VHVLSVIKLLYTFTEHKVHVMAMPSVGTVRRAASPRAMTSRARTARSIKDVVTHGLAAHACASVPSANALGARTLCATNGSRDAMSMLARRLTSHKVAHVDVARAVRAYVSSSAYACGVRAHAGARAGVVRGGAEFGLPMRRAATNSKRAVDGARAGTRASYVSTSKGKRMPLHEHPLMTRERVVKLGIPVTFTMSNVFGHLSFVLLGYSYLTSDLLTLRALAVGGLSFAVVFQYFRAAPLWLPIRWNALFVVINAVWVAKLYYDANFAELYATEDERALYARHFAHMSMTDFRKILQLGRWRDMERGYQMTVEGEQNKNVFVLVEGSAEVYVHGKAVNTIEAGSFVGEMSLMRSIVGSNFKRPKNQMASATVVCREKSRVFCWEDAQLRKLLYENADIRASMQAAFGVGLAEKLFNHRVMSSKMFAQAPNEVRAAIA